MLFPVQRPGDFITAEWELFALFFCGQDFIILLPKKKTEKKDFCGRPTGHNFGHPLHRKHTFFKGGLMGICALRVIPFI